MQVEERVKMRKCSILLAQPQPGEPGRQLFEAIDHLTSASKSVLTLGDAGKNWILDNDMVRGIYDGGPFHVRDNEEL